MTDRTAQRVEKKEPRYEENVFINCPFDPEYRPFLDALVFVIHDCGFVARSALELHDGGRPRFDTLIDIISGCKVGIHDISRMGLDRASGLPRFNMPFELGVFLGAKRLGWGKQKAKLCITLDREKLRYRDSLSDLAGLDIYTYDGGDPSTIIRAVRDPLVRARSGSELSPGPKHLAARYARFRERLPAICAEARLGLDDLSFFDYANIVATWLESNPRWEG